LGKLYVLLCTLPSCLHEINCTKNGSKSIKMGQMGLTSLLIHGSTLDLDPWREGPWGSDADADLAEKRFRQRLAHYRARRAAPPEAWLRRGSCLAEVLNAPAVRGGAHR
jgi:hypothetical protein